MVIRCSNGITIDRQARTITNRTRTIKFDRPRPGFDPGWKLITYLMLSGGASLAMAFWHIYGSDSDGGPLGGTECFDSWLKQWERTKFKELDVEWRSWRIAGVTFYEIVPVYQLHDPKRITLYDSLRRRGGRPPNSSRIQNDA
jgi:hypothetical protein